MIKPLQQGVGIENILPQEQKFEKGASFSDVLSHAFDEVNEDQGKANQAIKELIAGRNKNIHETMLVLEKADISLKMMMQVRNKIVEAYKEIMRMQI